jgi:hypothetical protein
VTNSRLRNRLIICWMMASALWIAGFSIYLYPIRPAPGFAFVASLAFGVPALLLVAMIGALGWFAYAGRSKADGGREPG